VELREAIEQISEIRAQIARTETFRGYRSLSVGFTGIIAIATGVIQAVTIPEPASDVKAYLSLWLVAAAVSIAVPAAEIAWRCRRAECGMSSRLTWMAVEQFLPCLFAGAVLTAVLYRAAAESLWMLPGLWAMFFGLGIFASGRLLPRPIFGVAIFYLVAGAMCLALAQGEFAFSPWAMAVPFGGGQLMTAAILYYTLERRDG
jgi:hypothetical protein